jgi:dihydroorotate dehydrogenase (fumarate)
MANLATTYLGLPLRHPIVASASPLSKTLDGIRRLEDAGAAAIVLFSLFEEQIRQENEALEHLSGLGVDSFAEALSYFPAVREYAVGPDDYLELIRRAKDAVNVPVIASLNGTTAAGWTRFARLMQQAGADAIELNIFHVPSDPDVNAADVEQRCVDVVAAVRSAVRIPVAVKVGPYFSAFGHTARRFVEAGASGLVLFNRFYQPDFDIEALEVAPTLELSSASEIRLPLLWIALLHGRLDGVSLAATTGVQTAVEVVKYLLAGADVVMTTSALLHYGVDYLHTLVQGLDGWLDARGFASVAQVRGSMSQRNVPDPEQFERANYIRILESWKHPFVR